MKNLLTIAAVVCAFALNAAPKVIPLCDGQNQVNACGEIVGIECMTIGESASVTASVVLAVTEYTNAFKTITTRHTRYDFTITNYDGNAAIATNTLDNFKYGDWIINGTNKIVGAVNPSTTNIAWSVSDGQRVKATYNKTIAIGNGNASGHYLLITPANAQYLFGGRIDILANKQDVINLMLK